MRPVLKKTAQKKISIRFFCVNQKVDVKNKGHELQGTKKTTQNKKMHIYIVYTADKRTGVADTLVGTRNCPRH